jgi:hypothetical protein
MITVITFHVMPAGRAAYTAGMLGYCQVAFLCTAADSTQQQHQQQSQQLSQQPSATLPPQQQQQLDVSAALLWGCDFVPWPTADLTLSTLFTAVQGCRFETANGSYVSLHTLPQQMQQQPQEQPQTQRRAASACAHEQRSTAAHGSGLGGNGTSGPLQECAAAQRGAAYACLHAPEAVLSLEQLSYLTNNCMSTDASANARPWHTGRGGSQRVNGAAGGFEVLVSLNAGNNSATARCCSVGLDRPGDMC